MVEMKQRNSIRAQREQLLTLVNGWDPVGLLAAGAPRSEYDCVIDELLGLLSRKATEAEIARFLEQEIADHFGTKPRGAGPFATKVVAWFEMTSTQQ
jgi:hypothetical protein